MGWPDRLADVSSSMSAEKPAFLPTSTSAGSSAEKPAFVPEAESELTLLLSFS